MARTLGLLSILATLCLSSGCAMCCHPYDYAYLYQGGAWQRNNPEYGRVGSAFTPEVGSPVAVSMPVDAAVPTPATRPSPAARPRVQQQPTLGENYLPAN